MRVSGSSLRVGDTIEVWWKPRRDTITEFIPYEGSLDLGQNPRIAKFAIYSVGMTILEEDDYELVHRSE